MTKEEFWTGLSGKSQWDAIVALRGPDIKRSEAVKAITTSVIRFHMSHIMRVGGQLSDLGFVIVPDGRVFKKAKTVEMTLSSVVPDLDHFLGHVIEAAEILDIPIVHVPAGLWEQMVLTGNVGGAFRLFLDYVESAKPTLSSEVESKVKMLMTKMGCGV